MSNDTEKVRVNLAERSYDIFIAGNLMSACSSRTIEALKKLVSGRKVMIVSDSNVAPLYMKSVSSWLSDAGASAIHHFFFEAGETSKNFETIVSIARAAASAGLDRSSVIVGLGGGVTGDMAAFAASIYMRGIDCIQIPTSLLAMIDSSVGGKTGVDLPEGKNLIGTFFQPKAVFMDTAFLNSLDARQLRTGFAELIKHAILFDAELFSVLGSSAKSLLALSDPGLLVRLIARSCCLKAQVVSGDEREGSKRMLLNLGHTFGHAIEKLQNYSGYTHGEALSVGLAMAADLAVRRKIMKDSDRIAIMDMLRKFGLPLSAGLLNPEMIFDSMHSDKKNRNGVIRLILPHTIGSCGIYSDTPDQLILETVRSFCD